MRAVDLTQVTRRKSSYSNQDGGQCLEVRDNVPSVVPVRDSKDTTRTPLLFAAPAREAFVDGVKRG